MREFKDNTGRKWVMSINVATVKKCRALLGVDLLALITDDFKPFAKLLADTVALIDVCYVCCTADPPAMDEDFARGMGGESLNHVATAFHEELADFFQDRPVREALRHLFTTVREATASQQRKLAAAVTKLTPALLEKAIEESRQPSSSATSGDAPVSSASSPTDGRSTN